MKREYSKRKFEELKMTSAWARVFNLILMSLYLASFLWLYFTDNCLYNGCSEELFWVVPVSIVSPFIFHYIKTFLIIPCVVYVIYGNES